MSDKGDRVQKWGELLAELAEDAEKFEREKQDKLLAENKKYSDFYETIELECANFQPNKLRRKLNALLKNNCLDFTFIVVFSFTCNLAKRDDYQDVVFKAFKTKAFMLRPLKILKGELRLYIKFLFSKHFVILIKGSLSILNFFFNSLFSGVLILISAARMGHSLENFFWQWLALTSIASVLMHIALVISVMTIGFTINCVILVFKSIFYPNSESLISDLKVLKEDYAEIIISEHRNIKLPELRLLFLELDKFGLQPVLVIKRETSLKVNLELQIKNSPKFRELLQ